MIWVWRVQNNELLVFTPSEDMVFTGEQASLMFSELRKRPKFQVSWSNTRGSAGVA